MKRKNHNIPWIHKKLLAAFGPQGWWPVTPPFGRRPVYSPRWTRGRLTSRQQFEVAVGALLTQNTAWTNVEKAMDGLLRERCLSPRRLANASRRRLHRLIRSSGYFRQKTVRLQNFSRHLEDRWGGRLERLLDRPVSPAREELLALNGVGPETADSILLYAGNHPVFVVDAYTRRIGRRFGLFRHDDYSSVQWRFMTALRPSVPVFREYHALLVELAKRNCRKIPDCGSCPIHARCRFAASRTSHAHR